MCSCGDGTVHFCKSELIRVIDGISAEVSFLLTYERHILLITTKNIYRHLHTLLLNAMAPGVIGLPPHIQAYLYNFLLNFYSAYY
jgi:hypothetical protein